MNNKNDESAILQAMKMPFTSKDAETAMLAHLSEKYGKVFQTVKLYEEFDGSRGPFYRLVFTEAGDEEPAVAYCYTEDSKEGETISVSEQSCLMTDTYTSILFGRDYQSRLTESIGGTPWLRCYMRILNYEPTAEDIALGAEEFLKRTDIRTEMFIFLVADPEENPEIARQVESFMSLQDTYYQRLYLGYQHNPNSEEWDALYIKHYGSFERYLVDESNADQVMYSRDSREDGYKEMSVVKE